MKKIALIVGCLLSLIGCKKDLDNSMSSQITYGESYIKKVQSKLKVVSKMGGFYLFYVLLGLPHFTLHSVLGITGILMLFISVVTHKKRLSAVLNIAGLICLAGSLVRFFSQPGGSYNYQTFQSLWPYVMMLIFAVVAIIFVVWNIKVLMKGATQ